MSLSEKREQSLIEDKMVHLNGFFAPRGGGGDLNKPIFKSSNAQGLPGGRGMLKLQFDWNIRMLKNCQTDNENFIGLGEGLEFSASF